MFLNNNLINYIFISEARQHGTGFLKFSKDEKKRKEQLDFLKEMEKERKVLINEKKKKDMAKEKIMKLRLEKVRQRKRLKMGLPAKEPSTEKILNTPPGSDNEDEELIGPMPLSEAPTEIPPAKKEDAPIRDWDLGKSEAGIMTQEEWVNKNRNERISEFAPPSTYNRTNSDSNINKNKTNFKGKRKANYDWPHNKRNMESASTSNIDNSYESSSERNWNFAPPATYEYYAPSKNYSKKTLNTMSKSEMEETINKGLSELRKNF